MGRWDGFFLFAALLLAVAILLVVLLVALPERRKRKLAAVLHGTIGASWLIAEAGNWFTPPVLWRFVIPSLLCVAALAFWPWPDPIPRRIWLVGIALDLLMFGLWRSQML